MNCADLHLCWFQMEHMKGCRFAVVYTWKIALTNSSCFSFSTSHKWKKEIVIIKHHDLQNVCGEWLLLLSFTFQFFVVYFRPFISIDHFNWHPHPPVILWLYIIHHIHFMNDIFVRMKKRHNFLVNAYLPAYSLANFVTEYSLDKGKNRK